MLSIGGEGGRACPEFQPDLHHFISQQKIFSDRLQSAFCTNHVSNYDAQKHKDKQIVLLKTTCIRIMTTCKLQL